MTASGADRTFPRSPRRPVHVGRWARQLVRGRSDAARWERPALLGLLIATAALYLVDLGVNGYANAFYAAAVQAGSQSWEAFFYGSSDSGNSITVDKPPAFLWVMGISVRLFGLSSWSLLVPEVLMGVASVALLYAIVRRRFSAGAALAAGAVLATTPVAALMFRYDNPDALLTLLTLLSIWLVLRGVETGRLRYVVWAGVAVGFAFLTKQLQGFLVLPVLVGVHLYCSALPLRRRIVHLSWAALAVVLSAGWWVAIVELVPASARPYIGGSQTNSFLELTFGYNGIGRVTGDEAGSVVPGGTGGAGSWGSTGLLRLFGSEFAGQITWLLPTALLLLVVSLVAIGLRRRTSVRLATVLLLGCSLLVTGVVFSLMGGIFHPYYTIALAPFIAGLVGIGAGVLWERRASWWARGSAAAAVVVTVVWQWHLLSETGSWQPWIRWVILVAGVVTAAAVLVPWTTGGVAVAVAVAAAAAARAGGSGRSGSAPAPAARAGASGRSGTSAPARTGGSDLSGEASEGGFRPLGREAVPTSATHHASGGGGFRPLGREAVPTSATHHASGGGRTGIPSRWYRPLAVVVVVGAAVTGLLGPTASTIDTVTTAHSGALPSAGPSVTGTGFGGGRAGTPGAGGPGAGGPGAGGVGGATSTGGSGGAGQQGGVPGGGSAGGSSAGQSGQGGQGSGTPSAPGRASSDGAVGGAARNGGAGNLLGGSTEVDSALRSALLADADDYTWVAATVGSNSAASYQLATGHAVMPIGGFNGTDPSPTLAEFRQDVADGAVHYFIASGTGSSQDSDDSASAITTWVEEHFTATSIGGVTVYDLTEAS